MARMYISNILKCLGDDKPSGIKVIMALFIPYWYAIDNPRSNVLL